VRSISSGKDAQGEVTVEVRHNEQVYRGRGVSTDIIEAAARAYLSVLNRVATQPTRQVPASSPVAAGTQ
jgi:2-isopropylmalate synthase